MGIRAKARTRYPQINPRPSASIDTSRRAITEAHFITFSCYERRPYLNTPTSRDIFLDSLERTRKKYQFELLGYVVMPEHIHLLMNQPPEDPLSKALQALKLSVSRRLKERPFWQTRYYDFNVFTHNKRVEKLKYMHRNPVTRGLVDKLEDWPWSSYRHYLLNETTLVLITKGS